MTRVLYGLGLVLLIILSATACKPSKKAKGGKGAGKGYHSMVSLFNGYYHAEKLYKEGMASAEKNIKIPPSGFLPLIPTKDQVVKASQFDRAVEKCDVIIFRHKKGDYVDDCYYLKGRCAFQRGEYFDAVVNFNYITVKYPDTPLALQIKLWQAKCAYAQDNPYRARRLLEEVLKEDAAARAKRKQKVTEEKAPVNKKKKRKTKVKKIKPPRLPERMKADVAELYCTLALQEEDYRGALKVLQENIKIVKNQKKRLTRWEFLMGQLYEHIANLDKIRTLADTAVVRYNRVINLNTNNDLTFRAKLNLAQLFIDHSPEGTDLETVLKPLYKLLKDAKFEDYFDQIYYRLALIEQKNKQTDKALGYYRKSAAVSTSNVSQKALSYYKAGHIYFYNKQNLDSALAYYDSSAAIALKSMPEYEAIVSMSDVLKQFDEHRKTIKLQDSLLKLSKLSDEALRAEIDKIVEKEEKDRVEKKKKEQQAQQQALSGMMRDQRMDQRNQSLTTSAAFYFDDPSQVERGKAMFQQNWGRRPNEDDWRRKNKQSKAKAGGELAEENLDELEGDELKKALEKKKERYYKNVPRDPEDVKASEEKLRNAMYELARLYSQRLNQPDKSIETYLKITQRFPGHAIVPEAYYGAYLVCEDIKHRDTKKYKDIILTQYPTSLYARLIRKEATNEATGDSFEEVYHTLYDLYDKGDYKTALQFSNYLLEKHAQHPDVAKAHYLRGMSYGFTQQMDSLRSIFKFMVQNYPDDAVTKLAQKTLAYVDGSGASKMPEQSNLKESKTESKTSSNNPNLNGFGPRKASEPIVVVMLVPENMVKQKDLEATLSDMHQALFAGQSIRASAFMYYDPQKGNFHLAYINQFPNSKAADDYLKTAKDWEGLKGLFNKYEDEAIFMAASNFRTAFSQKRMHHYLEYYKANKLRMLAEE